MFPKKRTGIKRLVIIVAMLPTLTALVFVSMYSYYTRTTESEKSLLKNGELLITYLTSASELALITGDVSYLYNIVSEIMDGTEVYAINIMDQNGISVLSKTKEETLSTADFSGNVWRHLEPAGIFNFSTFGEEEGEYYSKGNKLGKVTIKLSRSEIEKEKWAVLTDTIALGIISLFLCALLAILIGRKISEPINKIIEGVKLIRKGKYDTIIGEVSNNEIGALSLDIDMMTKELSVRLYESENNMEMLAGAVSKSTEELRAAHAREKKINAENRRLIKVTYNRIEDERKYVSRELHDELNANLITMKLNTSQIVELAKKNKQSESMKAIIRSASILLSLIDRTYKSGRAIINRLRPEIFDALGLVGALDDLINNYKNSNPSYSIKFSSSGEFDVLKDEKNMAIYRIIQECLVNAIKHADANIIKIILSNPCHDDNKMLCLEVSDDGIGFNSVDVKYGIGILSIRERVNNLAGDVLIKSSINNGCTITVRLPVN